jgi:hypothetical protein
MATCMRRFDRKKLSEVMNVQGQITGATETIGNIEGNTI